MTGEAANPAESPQHKVCAALNALTILDEQRANIEREAVTICGIAALTRFNELPRAREAGSSAAARELDQLGKLAFRLWRHIMEEMHREALAALEAEQKRGSKVRHPFQTADDLRALMEAINRAEPAVPVTSAPTGAPEKRWARDTTSATVKAYERLTGRRATISVDGYGKSGGACLTLLRIVFEACNIDASPASQLRACIGAKEESQPKNGA